ncbi:MAG: sensor histidine kinase [Phycisphaerae bacterium]|nr:sensor histidine kinase [Phycisphaerae bacterium]
MYREQGLASGVRGTPLGVFATVMVLVFAAEGAIMLVLPLIGPWARPTVWEAVTDAALLSVVLSPALWYAVVRPWRGLNAARTQLLARVFEAQEAERQRLGRDLHDELGQQLTAIMIHARTIETEVGAGADGSAGARAKELSRMAAGTLEEVRRLARGLRPDVLDDFGLVVALERLCEDFRAAHGVGARVDAEGVRAEGVDPEAALAAYRIAQEALTNVARHAGARTVRVEARIAQAGADATLTLEIEDDGQGLARGGGGGTEAPERRGSGIQGMRERAALLGGTLSVRGRPGGGTVVSARIPLRGARAAIRPGASAARGGGAEAEPEEEERGA